MRGLLDAHLQRVVPWHNYRAALNRQSLRPGRICKSFSCCSFFFPSSRSFGNLGRNCMKWCKAKKKLFLWLKAFRHRVIRFIIKRLAKVGLIWLFICMGNPVAINIITHIIHHPRPRWYTLTASQPCTALGYASNVRLKMVFATFTSPPEHFLTHQEMFSDYTLTYLSEASPMCAEDACMWHIKKGVHSWVHFTDITSAVINIL